MKRLILALALLCLLVGSAFATITTSYFQSAYGHYMKGTWTSSGAKQCLTQVDGEPYKAWTITIAGTATVKIEASPDAGGSFNTLATYTQANAAPIGGEANNYYTDFCVEVTVCTGCTVTATISTGYAKNTPHL